MRKLVSKQERKKNSKRNQIVAGVVLVFLMIFSTLGFALQGGFGNSNNQDGEAVVHNGFQFTNINGFWVWENFVFKYNPKEVPNIGDNLKEIDSYRGKPLYIYSENEESNIEVYVNLGQVSERVQEACLEGSECANENFPIKTCTDNFIIIKEGNNEVRQEDNCVYISGPQSQLTKLTDQFLFKILGIN